MGRGRSSGGGGGRGMSSSGRGRSSSSGVRWGGGSRTTVIIGGSRHYHSHGHSSSSSGGSAIGGFVMGIVICLIFAIILTPLTISSFKKHDRYDTVSATALDNLYSGGWYYTEYEYTVKGVEYQNVSTEGWEFPEVEGRTVTIYYLKANPNVITEKSPPSLTTCWACLGADVFVIFLGGLLIVGLVQYNKSKKNQPQPKVQSSSEQATPVDDRVTCPYCGTKHIKNATSCPNCGASNK